MADNIANITLKVKAEGMTENVKNSQLIKDNLTAASSVSNKINSKVASATSPTASAARAGARTPIENLDYAVGRSTIGTGAASRDFAKQAQGLSGLVHLYATFAANIFAAGAAFRALSSAMDTSNMVKGLDQLGSAVGKNLVFTAKQLAIVSDGALSLKDAMQATAMASSAGLSSDQISKLGEVAKKSSQALGRDMSDAFSRLSRGITKLEPELLDELGLFTKIGPATENYARSVGKSVTSLTDFEKRQAFANAVLKEGLDKFSGINLESNPFSKLLASATNLMQTGLELVNKVLGPVAKLLSESPTALLGVITLIGAKLLSTAMPALVHWRENLKGAAVDAAKTAKAFRDSFGDEFQSKLDQVFKIPDLQKQLKKAEDDIVAFKKNTSGAIGGIDSIKSKSLGSILSDPINDQTSKNLSGVQSLLTGRLKLLAADADGTKKLEAAKKAQLDTEVKGLTQVIEQTKALRALEDARAKKKIELDTAYAAQQTSADKPVGFLDPERIATAKAVKLEQQAAKAGIVSNAAYNASILGVRGSWQLLNQEIEKNGITGISKYTTLAKGGLTAVATRVMGIASAFSSIGMVIAVAIGAFQLLDSWFSNNSKESAATSDAFEKLHSTAALVDEVLGNIAKKDPLAAISTASINARASSLNELADTLASTFDRVKAQIDKTNWWDSLINGTKGLVGKDVISSSAKEFAYSITQALKVAMPGAKTDKALGDVSTLLGVDPRDFKAVMQVVGSSEEVFLNLAPKVTARLKELGIELGNTASNAKQLDMSFEAASKQMDIVLNSAVPSEPMAKLGMDFIAIGSEMSNALKDPITSLSQLAEISGNTAKLRFFPSDIAQNLQSNSAEIKKTVSYISELTAATEQLNAKESALAAKRKMWTERYMAASGGKDSAYIQGQINKEMGGEEKQVSQAKSYISGLLATQTKIIEPYMDRFKKANAEVFAIGADMVSTAIAQGFTKAAITVQTAFAGALSGTVAGADLGASLQNQSISLQIASNNATLSLVEATEKLRSTNEETNLRMAKQDLSINPKGSRLDNERALHSIDDKLEAVIKARDLYKGPRAMQEIAGTNGLRSDNESVVEAARGRLASVEQKTAIASQNAQLAAQQKSNLINKELQQRSILAGYAKQELSYEGNSLSNNKTMLDMQHQYADFLSEESILSKNSLDDKIAANKYTLEQFDLVKKIFDAQYVIDNSGNDSTKAKALASQTEYYNQLASLGKKETQDENTRNAQTAQFKLANNKKVTDAQLASEELVFNTRSIVENTLLTLREDNLSKLSTLGATSPEDAAREQGILDIEKERLRNKEQLFRLDKESKAAQADLTLKIGSTADGAEKEALKQKLTDTQAYYNSSIAAENQLTQSRVAGVAALTDQKVQLAQVADITNSLNVLFKDLGSTMGGVLSAITSMGTSMKAQADAVEQNTAAQKAAQSIISDGVSSVKAKEDAEAALTDAKTKGLLLEKSGTKLELDNASKVTGATKKLFAEKTFAFKALANVEKAMHIAKLAMMIKEMFLDTTVTSAHIANTAAAATVDGAGAVVNQGKGDPYTAFARMAAMAAIVATVLSSIGGKGSKIAIPAGMSAKDRQETQGTGYSHDALTGKKVENGGGVYGDPAAHTQSIAKSLEIVKATSIEGLDSSNQMVKLLSNIDVGINGVAKSLYGMQGVRTSLDSTSVTKNNLGAAASAVAGLILGGPVGAIIGGISSKVSGAIFGKTTVTKDLIDSGVSLKGSLIDLATNANKAAQAFQNINTTTKNSGALFGLIGGGTSSKVSTEFSNLSPEYTKELQSVFSYSVNLMEQLGSSLGKSKESVDAILKTIDVSSFTSLKDLTGQDFVDALSGMINTALDKASTGLFSDIVNKYKTIGESALQTVVRVIDSNDKVNLALQAMGANTVDAVLNAQNAAGKLTKTVLTMTTTSTGGIYKWLGNTLKAITTGTTSIQKYTAEDIKQASIDITEALVAAAGSLDKFVSQSKFFTDNFLTESERLAPIQQSLNDKFAALGISGIDSRDAFKKLVLSLDLTTKSGQDMYQSLMDMASSFAMVYPQLQKSMTAEEYRTKILSDEIEIQKLLGNVYKATLMSREEELAQLALYPEEQAKVLIANRKTVYALQDAIAATNQRVNILKAEGKTTEALTLQRKLELLNMDDRLRASQEYIYALTDEASILSDLTKARDTEKTALDTTISSIKGFVDNIKKYKASLLSGSGSILTPQQKYQQAKQELNKLASLSLSPAVTDAEKVVQKDALDNLSSAAQAFLDSSQGMFASSDQYVTDYNSVMQILDQTSNVLGEQQSAAQQQLDQLVSSTAFLDSINANTKTTAQLLSDYFAAQQATALAKIAADAAPSAAITSADVQGSLASLVETASSTNVSIPEAPSRATAQSVPVVDTTMTDQISSLTAQISSLQAEVAGLRADQAAQTAALINTNVAATTSVATAVTSTAKNAAVTQVWNSRNIPAIA
jgi:hypothetical protein